LRLGSLGWLRHDGFDDFFVVVVVGVFVFVFLVFWNMLVVGVFLWLRVGDPLVRGIER